jgi:hypothetical protein
MMKTTKISVRIAGLSAEIWTRDLPNTKECQPFDYEIRLQRRAVSI